MWHRNNLFPAKQHTVCPAQRAEATAAASGFGSSSRARYFGALWDWKSKQTDVSNLSNSTWTSNYIRVSQESRSQDDGENLVDGHFSIKKNPSVRTSSLCTIKVSTGKDTSGSPVTNSRLVPILILSSHQLEMSQMVNVIEKITNKSYFRNSSSLVNSVYQSLAAALHRHIY